MCFDCAGVPVIRRIVANMRAGGVSRFVVVVGHHAQSVMDCLDGEPGVYSARYAGEGHDSEANMAKLLRKLGDNNNRKARFRTVFALIQMIGGPYAYSISFYQGIVNGEITKERSGCEGFGYDPIFRPDGYDKTFAELGAETKDQISHRAIAARKLADYLSGRSL